MLAQINNRQMEKIDINAINADSKRPVVQVIKSFAPGLEVKFTSCFAILLQVIADVTFFWAILLE